MRKRRGTELGMLVVLLVAVAVLGTVSTKARAQCSDSFDLDCDGFLNTEEDGGIELPPGLTLLDGTTTFLPNFDDALPGTPREECVHQDTPDLFVILAPETLIHIPADPLEFVSEPQVNDGLGITVHLLKSSVTNRNITSSQKAAKITEDLDPVGNVLGFANQGTPNQIDLAVIYTQRIINHVNSVCAGASQCKDDTGATGDDLHYKYIKHTLAHEFGHLLDLASKYDKKFGGHHYRTGTGVFMDQSVKYTKKGDKVIFYIGTTYTSDDQSKYKLK